MQPAFVYFFRSAQPYSINFDRETELIRKVSSDLTPFRHLLDLILLTLLSSVHHLPLRGPSRSGTGSHSHREARGLLDSSWILIMVIAFFGAHQIYLLSCK